MLNITNFMGIYTYPEVFQKFPNKWLLVSVLKRDGCAVYQMSPLRVSDFKDEIMEDARQRVRAGEDVAVISTMETLEDAKRFVVFDNDVKQLPYVTPEEYAFMFNLYYGMTVMPENVD